MRQPRAVCAVAGFTAAVCLVLTGCDRTPANEPGVDYSELGVPVPSPSGRYATPDPKVKSPGDNASPSEQVLFDLQQRVVRTAGVAAPTTATCAGGVITGTVDQSVDCAVVYQGLRVTYRVEITGGTPTFSWVATTEKSVLTAEGVGRAYWAKYGAEATAVRCDKMPQKRLVRLGEDTDFRCYHEGPGGWTEHAVLLKDGGINFESTEPA
ncbi:MAG TPA: hypothetical protein VHJ83_08045 [Micromonosporaceae bacterium]|nr:hypothetical protein [Micromonosporaceae bacterium]